ncbi:MAG: terminase large subunit [Acidobacteriota bacterium]
MLETDPATAYAEAVVSGDQVAGAAVRWACERHLHDLATAHERGWFFDLSKVERVLNFCGLVRHFEGKWGRGQGQVFEPSPWQVFVVGSIFGWVDEAGFRRYRHAFIEVARKNGKSFLLSALGLYLLCADGEPGAQIVNAATKLDQARIIHRAAIKMRAKSPLLRREIDVLKDRLIFEPADSFFIPLGAEPGREDGRNPHAALIDELHAHRTSEMYDVLDSALGARDHPLMLIATTAGSDIGGFGGQKYEEFRSLIDPRSGISDDRAFVFIAELDDDDDPIEDPSCWVKANPNLGVSKKHEHMEIMAGKARRSSTDRANFLVKDCNRWTSGGETWLRMDRWDACAGELVRA